MSSREIERDTGARARRLLEDPLIVGAYDTIRGKIITSWTTCTDAGQREKLWQELKALERIYGEIRAVVTTGKMAEQQLEAKKNG